MTKPIAVKIVAYAPTEYSDLYDISLKTAKRPYKSFVIRMSVDDVGSPPVIGKELMVDIDAKAPVHKVDTPVPPEVIVPPPPPPPVVVPPEPNTKALRRLHDVKISRHYFILNPGEPTGIECPRCGAELIDGSYESLRQTLDGTMAVVLCAKCDFRDNRIVKGI